MTYDEFLRWIAYRKLRGPLNPMLRQDYGFALIAMMINHAVGGKAKLDEFMLWQKEPEGSIDDLAKIFGAKFNKTKEHK